MGMNSSGIVKRTRLGDDVLTYCGKCKEERNHQVVALTSDRRIERVVCRYCRSDHLYRDGTASVRKAVKGKQQREALAREEDAAAARVQRQYSTLQVYAAGDFILHPKFGTGKVIDAREGKIQVRFGDQIRTLLHAG